MASAQLARPALHAGDARPAAFATPAVGAGSARARSTATGSSSHDLLASPPLLSLWRAPIDNDRIPGLAATWDALGLAHLQRTLVAHGGD